ncbi:MAG: protoporphyrinogen oxidase [bacterium]|nr:protoporphyrinogen oxidase [bacterium]
MQKKQTDILILGAGLSGLAASHFLGQMVPQKERLILEKTQRPGGAIRTFKEAGIQAEWGAHGFLDNGPESLLLIEQLGLAGEVTRAPLKDFVRFICRQGRLQVIPQSPPKILASPILPLSAKLRVLGDLWTAPLTEDQSIADWARRRFGPALAPFVDAAVTGTYGGDMERLSIDAAMPRLRQMELASGSVIRALKARAKDRKGQPRRLPEMISFKAGMERLPQKLAEGQPILYGQEVTQITKEGDFWVARTADLEVQASQLLVALPASRAWPLLATLSEPPGPAPVEAQIANLVLAFDPPTQVPFGFGYLAPREEKRFALGCLYSSHMFAGRCPAGGVLLECLVGGRLYPERLGLKDSEIIDLALKDLAELLPLPEPPRFAHLLRPPQGIPQPELGHPARLAWRADLMRQYPGLAVFGFGWDGIGINDMTRGAQAVARYVTSGELDPGPRLKGVYF